MGDSLGRIRVRDIVLCLLLVGFACATARATSANNGTGSSTLGVYKPAIGFIGGCTGTVVSPPGAEVTAVLFAAHCPGGPALKLPNGFVNGFNCYQNRDFYAPERQIPQFDSRTGITQMDGSTGDDVGICFAKQNFTTPSRVHGCLSRTPVGPNDELRFMGFGNPTVGLPPVDNLLDGTAKVHHIQSNGAIIAEGPQNVTPGDSGGPVVRITDELRGWAAGFFEIVGVNSKALTITTTDQFGFETTRMQSTFAPFTEDTRAFFTRAIARFKQEGGSGVEAKVCGVNWDPKKAAEPTKQASPTATPTGGAHDEPIAVEPPKTRAIDNRPAGQIFGERLKVDFPSDMQETDRFLRWLDEIAQEETKRKLTEVLRQPDSQEFRDFINGLGAMPPKAILAKIRTALMKNAAIADGEVAQPSSGMNAPWLKVLNDPQLALRRPDQALALLNTLRALARKGDAGNAELEGIAARWAASLTGAQRKRAAELLEKFTPPSDGVPSALHQADLKIKRFLTEALVERPSSATDNPAARAQKEARAFAQQWNATLDDAVADPTKIDLDREIAVREKNGQKMKVGDWIRQYVHQVGYDELVRWASSAGGDTGRKTLALLARLGGAPGQPAIGVEVDRGEKVDVSPSADKKQPIGGDAVLRLQPSADPAKGLDAQLRSLVPPGGNGWDKIHFTPSDHLPTGPHPSVGFENFSSPQTPPVASDRGVAPLPAMDRPGDPAHGAVQWPDYRPMTPTPTATPTRATGSAPQPPSGTAPTATPTPTPTGTLPTQSVPSVPDQPLPDNGSATRPEISTPVAHAMGACVNCHQQRGIPGVGSPEQLSAKIGDMSSDRFEEMLRKAMTADPSIDHQAMRNFYESARRFNQANASFSGNPLPACYGTEAKQRQQRESMPAVATSSSALAYRLAAAKRSGHMMFYDSNDVPETYQVTAFDQKQWQMGLPDRDGHTLKYGYSNHANREFPWRSSAGTDLSPNVVARHFIIPAGQRLGQFVRVPNSTDTVGTGANPAMPDAFTVKFDADTTFGEEIQVRDPDTGENLTTEIRLRIKKPDGTWKMDVLRPFENPAELAAAVRALVDKRPDLAGDAKVKAFLAAMDNPVAPIVEQDTVLNRMNQLPPRQLNKPAIDAVAERAAMHDLPDLPHEVVRTLLKTTPFKSVFGKPWITSNGTAGWAPTTQSDFQIVPKNYFGAFVPTTDQACIKCHQTAGMHVDNFDHPQRHGFHTLEDDVRFTSRAPFGAPYKNRSWYDNVRGMYQEGILSWNPGDAARFKQMVSEKPYAMGVGPWVFNQCLGQGLISGLPQQ